MREQTGIKAFDWERIFYSQDIPYTYLIEIGFRTLIMFIILILILKLLSKRGVKQLSVFELAILIALGSATGDPMFYYYIPVTYGIVVLLVVIILYRVITGLTGKSKFLETMLEGKPVCLLTDGRIEYENYKRIGLPYDKFFAELRLKNAEHLGQVKKAYLETSGEISIYMLAEDQVRPGLPILPELIAVPVSEIYESGNYACLYCGHVQNIMDAKSECVSCCNHKWVLAKSDKRIQ
jgi:uncharacterized membrane protein YcaP (DUF421 family)